MKYNQREANVKNNHILLLLHALVTMVFANDILACVNKECITKSDIMKVVGMRYGTKEYEALDEKVKKKILKGLQGKLLVTDAAKRADHCRAK